MTEEDDGGYKSNDEICSGNFGMMSQISDNYFYCVLNRLSFGPVIRSISHIHFLITTFFVRC